MRDSWRASPGRPGEGAPPHTQWPGDGGRDDPALATFLAGQEPFPGDIAAAHNDMLAGAVGLLERIGPSVLLTHSFGGGFGWLARSECPSLVRAVVAVEPAGPPFVTLGHGAADAATAGYLRSCGADVDELRLGELGRHGNGHAMMLEKNNAEIAALITDWIVKHL
jgi:pimeloyl-ACP methyl ester carboxylesterase